MKIHSNPFVRALSPFATCLMIALGTSASHSATRDWSASAADPTWATGNNWVGGTAPVDSLTVDDARFNQNNYAFQPNYGSRSINKLVFGDGTTPTAPVTLSGTTLSLGGTISVNANSGAVSINGSNPVGWATSIATNNSTNPLTIGAGFRSRGTGGTTTFTFNGSGPISVSGPINNGGGTNEVKIVKSGAGTLSLSGANTFKGGIQLSGSTVGSQINLNSTTALGGADSRLTIDSGDNARLDNTSGGALTIINNNPQTWSNNFTFIGSNDLNMGSGNITLVANRTITVTAKNLTLAGVVTDGSGAFNLTKAGAGTLILTNSNTYDGVTTITNGILRVTNTNALGSTTAGAIANSTGSLELVNGLSPNGSEALNISGSGFNFSGALRAGTGGGTWAGPISIGGTSTRLGALAGQTLTITGTIADGASNTFAVTGESGTGVILINPSTSNTYTGKTDIIRGILRLGKTDALPTGTMLDVDSANGVPDAAVLDLAGFNQTASGLRDGATSSFSGKVTNSVAGTNSTLTLNQSETTFYEGIIEDGAGTVSLVKNGSGTLELNGINTHTGPTSLNGGRINVGGTLASPLTVAADTILGGEGSISGQITFSEGTSSLVFDPGTTEANTTGQALTVTSPITTGAIIRVSPSTSLVEGTIYTVLKNTVEFSGAVSDTFVPGTRGTLAFSADNKELLFTANTPLTTPLVWKGDALTNPTFWDVNNTANWDNGTSPDKFFNSDSVNFDDTATTNTVVIQGPSIAVGQMTFNNPTKHYSISGGSLTGTGGIVKNGNASLTLSNANTFNGGTTLNAGTININTPTALGAATSAFIINGGTIDNTSGAAVTTVNYPLTINNDITFTGTNDLNLGSGATTLGTTAATTRTITTTAGTLRLGGVIANGVGGANQLIKAGAGTLTLAGASTYTDLTTISEGTLRLGANSSATVGPLGSTISGTEVASGATIDFGGFGVNVEPIRIAGTGVNGNGALVNSGGDQTGAVRFLTLTANASIGASGNRYDIRGSSAASPGTLSLDGHTLTKTGSGTVAIVNTTVDAINGKIDIVGGTLGLHATNSLNEDTSNTFIVRNNATLDCFQSGTWNSPVWPVIMEAGSNFTTSSGSTSWNSTVTLNGAANLGGAATLTLNGVVTGASGALTKTGAGTLNLNGTEPNNYGGLATTVSAGTLALGKSPGVNAVPGDITIGAGGVSSQAAEQIPNDSTVTLTTATSKFNINTWSETLANVNMQDASNTDSQGLLTGAAGKLTITGTLTHTLGNITLNSSGIGNSSEIIANAVINNGGNWTFGVSNGTQKLIIGPGGLVIGNGSTIAVNAVPGTADNFISLSGDVISNAAATTNTISGLGKLNLNGIRSFTVADGTPTSDLTVSSVIANGTSIGALIKNGTGVLSLNAVNTYTGDTTVNAGTITGAGSVAGLVSVGTSGTIAPGIAIGSFTAASADFTAGGSLAIEINDSLTPKTDTLVVTGELKLTNAKLNLSITGAPAQASYTIATAAAVTGTFAPGNVTGLPSGYALAYTNTEVKLIKGGFSSWITNPTFGLLPADQDPTDDPDADGLNNMTEFALDGNPASGATSNKIVGKIATVGGTPSLVITLPVRGIATTFTKPNAPQNLSLVSAPVDGIIYRIQNSNTLADWTLDVTEVASGNDKSTIEATMPPLSGTDWSYRTFKSSGIVGVDPNAFLRAAIEAKP